MRSNGSTRRTVGSCTSARRAMHWLLLLALVVLVVASAYAGKEFRGLEVAILAAVMCAMAAGIFIWGLGLPYPLFAFEFGR